MESSVTRSGQAGSIRTDWTVPEVAGLFELPLHELLYRAHCRELLDRVRHDRDTRAATTAELLGVLSALSLCGNGGRNAHVNAK